METARPNPDEIDILHQLVKLFRFILKHWLFMLVIVGVSVGLSWLSFKNAERTFESKMVVRSEFLSESNAAQIIDNLQKLSDESNDSLYASRLNLTVAEAQTVKKISVKSSLFSGALPTDLDKMAFLIIAEVSDPSVLPKLQRGILSYFDNNEFLKVRMDEKKKGFKNLIEQIDREIAGLGTQASGDESGSLYLSRQTKSKDKDIRSKTALQFDPSTLRIFMYKDRIDAEEKLAFLRGVEMIDGFTSPRIPNKPNVIVYLTSGLTSGILISLFFLGLQTINRLTKKYPA